MLVHSYFHNITKIDRLWAKAKIPDIRYRHTLGVNVNVTNESVPVQIGTNVNAMELISNSDVPKQIESKKDILPTPFHIRIPHVTCKES